MKKIWDKIPHQYQGYLVGAFLFLLVVWSIWSEVVCFVHVLIITMKMPLSGQVWSVCGLAQVRVNLTQCFHSLFLDLVNASYSVSAYMHPDPKD